MALITIDQKPFEVEQQKNLLETAISLGLDLPYFCWHPALGSVGSCRLCAVQQFADENDTVGRTVMACMTPVKDKMCFSVEHPIAKDFRSAVVEWIMTNHPHDCPVCDEGGECHLQDMTLLSGHNYRDYRFLKRTHRNQNLGPFVNHEMNRCITCYRCVRYYHDLAGGSDLSAFKSSGKVYFGRFTEGPLESEFSGNLVEICPTGVFTDKPYHQRFVRKWDLATSPSVCQLCSVGCNISIGERTSILRRVQNRYHHDINGFFICDRGRFGHDFVNSDRRLKTHRVKQDGVLTDVSADEAVKTVSRLLDDAKSIIGIGSPHASLEANFVLKRLVGAPNFYDGLPQACAATVDEAVSTLRERAVSPASLKHVREADCVVVIGEDLTNSAPITALAIRQAAMNFKQRLSQQTLNIDPWNDAAVRDFARGDLLPVISLTSCATSLDAMAHAHHVTHPFAMANVVRALCDAVAGEAISHALPQEALTFVERATNALLVAKSPVVIAGASLGEAELIRGAKELAHRLDQKNNATHLQIVLPDMNSVGFSMLKPQKIVEKVNASSSEMIDVAIVLEHDLSWRLGSKPFQALCQRVKHLIVVDSLHNETTKAASVALASLSFLEASGTLISSEGRLQRYYGASAEQGQMTSSFHMLAQLLPAQEAAAYKTIDDVSKDLARELDIKEDAFDRLFDSEFRILGQKIPRQTVEATGRTAIAAHINVHEQKPPSDPDSPLSYTMEGARKKIPLPLISSSWAPRWNSVQASFKTILSPVAKEPDAFGGVRLFAKAGGVKLAARCEASAKKLPSAPNFYVVPKHHIFASFPQAKFSSSLATRMPNVEAEISANDAQKLGFTDFAPIVLETPLGKFSVLAKTKEDVPEGVLFLPFGLVDAALFFANCLCRVESSEQV